MTRNDRSTVIGIVAAVIGVIVFCYLVFRFTTVDSNEVGVYRRFGVVQPVLAEPGLRYVPPFTAMEKVTLEYTDLTFNNEAADAGDDSPIEALTKDGITYKIPMAVSWAINPAYLPLVKARLPGHYTDREYTIIRSAVRDAVAQFNYADMGNRAALEHAISEAIIAKTTNYYTLQGYGDASSRIVLYGQVTLRGVWNDGLVNSRQALAEATIDAQTNAAKTAVPAGRSVADYTKVIQTLATAKALEDGKANVTVITGNTPAAAIINSTSK